MAIHSHTNLDFVPIELGLYKAVTKPSICPQISAGYYMITNGYYRVVFCHSKEFYFSHIMSTIYATPSRRNRSFYG